MDYPNQKVSITPEGSAPLVFYPGLHQPSDCRHFDRCFVSINRLKDRKSDFLVNSWIMDSGAFTQLNRLGYFDMSPGEYADHIVRWSRCGNLVAACAQDYMCEPFMFPQPSPAELDEMRRDYHEYLIAEGAHPLWLEWYPWEWEPHIAGVRDHQEQTVYRYGWLCQELRDRGCDTYIMPVLQGYRPGEYVECIELYEQAGHLPHGSYVGVGSVCKRNADPMSALAVLRAIKKRRPDLRLHGFGLKLTAVANPEIRRLLHSADSMAWSDAARKERNKARKKGEDWTRLPSPNDWRTAAAYEKRMLSIINENHNP